MISALRSGVVVGSERDIVKLCRSFAIRSGGHGRPFVLKVVIYRVTYIAAILVKVCDNCTAVRGSQFFFNIHFQRGLVYHASD